MTSRSRSTPKIRPRPYRCHQRQCRAISSQARAALKTMQYNNFCLTLNSRARAARACFLRRTSQKMRNSFEQTGLRADEPRPRRSILSYRGARRRIRARPALKTMQYNNFCLTLNSRARAARACFLRQSSQDRLACRRAASPKVNTLCGLTEGQGDVSAQDRRSKPCTSRSSEAH